MGTNETNGALERAVQEVRALVELIETRQQLLEADLRRHLVELQQQQEGRTLVVRVSRLTAAFGQLEERVTAIEEVLRSLQRVARTVRRRRPS